MEEKREWLVEYKMGAKYGPYIDENMAAKKSFLRTLKHT